MLSQFRGFLLIIVIIIIIIIIINTLVRSAVSTPTAIMPERNSLRSSFAASRSPRVPGGGAPGG